VTPATVLAFDFGSRHAGVALARGDDLLAARVAPRAGRDADLLPLIEEACREAGVDRAAIGEIVALAGPGSFTGIRVACATALGLAAALEVPASGLSTLAALALAAPAGSSRPLAVVDALRGEWFVQPFERVAAGEVRPLAKPKLTPPRPDDLEGADLVVGEDAPRFLVEAGLSRPPAHLPPNVAASAALAVSRGRAPVAAELLRRPLYLRPPATKRGA